jgi:hypothetical protein
MTYPPGGPGYSPAQQHGPYAPTTQFKVDEGPSKLPVYLLGAVVVLGLAAYLVSFGPVWKSSEMGPVGGTSITGGSLEIVGLLLAALLAAVGLIPKGRNYTAIIAVIAVVGFLLAISELINKPSFLSIGWALIVIVVLAGFQAIAAVGALLLEAGVITPPAPRPKYDQYQQQYGLPGGGYYGQQQHTPQQNFGQQRPGYPQQYGGYPSGPSTGGFPQAGPPTPPTGFPAYGQPPSSSAPTQQVQAVQPDQSSAPSGPAPS